MECCICTSLPFILRPPRNTICGMCFEAARNTLELLNNLQTQKRNQDKEADKSMTLSDVSKWVSDMKDATEKLNEKIKFLSAFDVAFKDQIHTDIILKPGDDGPSIPAHKALLAVRSEVFKNMLDTDECKTPANETVTLSELTHEELESLMEFLYNGSLAEDKMNRHVYSLSLAADKYNIPYLHKICERHMLDSLCSSNALAFFEIADCYSFQVLKEVALKFIVKDMEKILFSKDYEAFALKNPHLSVQITRASFVNSKIKVIS
ncbi:hypothetical protein UlMin_043878 [Ulmus minor]